MNLQETRRIVGFLAVLTSIGTTLAAAATASASQPNILVILADDMNWRHPGFNGGPASTPNLDKLALEGTRLTQFYAHSVCSPTRAAFLTGRYPFRNGMEERSHGNDVAGMLTDERTLAETFGEADYFTAIIGKWHLGNWHTGARRREARHRLHRTLTRRGQAVVRQSSLDARATHALPQCNCKPLRGVLPPFILRSTLCDISLS